MESAGGFDHNANTIRVLTLLEMPYPDCTGLNLSWETLEALAKHYGPVTAPPWALAQSAALHPLALHTWPTLAAPVVALADDSAYDHHAIDDCLHSEHLSLEHLLPVPFFSSRLVAVS